MSQPYLQPPAQVPRWLIWAGSLAIIVHLGGIGVNALAAWSGPWPTEEGMIPPPLFAAKASEVFAAYLKPTRMNQNYHVLANHIPGQPGVCLEFRLKNEDGKEIASVKVPDDNANPWVRHRHSLLTQQYLWEDRPVSPQQSELIAAPGGKVPQTQYWEMEKGQLRLVTVDVNRVPLAPAKSGPSETSFMLARTYARYLCRTHGAAKAEVLRHHQNAIRPFVLHQESVSERDFAEVISNFGEFSR